MSQRELKSLYLEGRELLLEAKLRSEGKNPSEKPSTKKMDVKDPETDEKDHETAEVAELKHKLDHETTEVAKLKKKLKSLERELSVSQSAWSECQHELHSAENSLVEAQAEKEECISVFQDELSKVRLQTEVEKLRELELVRREFDLERKQLREDREQDCRRFQESENSLIAEKEEMSKLISQLRQELAVASRYVVVGSPGVSQPLDTEHSKGATRQEKSTEAENVSLTGSVVPKLSTVSAGESQSDECDLPRHASGA